MVIPYRTARKGEKGAGYLRDSWNLQWHFSYRHPEDRMAVGGAFLHKCRLCGMQVSTVGTPAHKASKMCQKMAAVRRQHAMEAHGKAALH